MLQPFKIMKPVYLEKIKKLERFYLVSQTYSRGENNYPDAYKTDILLSDYNDFQYAQVHYNAIKKDKYAAIIDLRNEKHYSKIKEMMSGDNYLLYWAVVESNEKLEQKLDKVYKEKVKHYIEKNTTWRISAKSTLTPKLEVIFGELFLNIRHSSQRIKVKFEDIEKM